MASGKMALIFRTAATRGRGVWANAARQDLLLALHHRWPFARRTRLHRPFQIG